MENKHPINDIMGITMEKVRQMVDANTVIGEPIHTPEGVTVIPISKISVGFASGGSDFATKNQPANKENAFGGGAGAGLNIDPVGFLIIKSDSVRMLPVMPSPDPMSKVIDLMPDLVDKVTGLIDQKKAEKAKKETKTEKADKENQAEKPAEDSETAN